MKLKTNIGFIALLLGSSLLLTGQTTTKQTEPAPVLPPGFPALPDTIVVKRPDPTPEQIAAAEKAREAQAAAVRARWEKEFAPWLHVAPPKPAEPVPFDREKALKEHAEKKEAHRAWVKQEAAKRGLPTSLKSRGGGTAVLDIGDDGSVTYFQSANLSAARTVRADQLWQPNAFNLHGSNVAVGVFEVGNLRASHYVFNNFTSTIRATNAEVTFDNDNEGNNNHATHVAGTLGGYFYNATNATGMARGSKLFRLDGQPPISLEVMHYDYGSQLGNVSVEGAAGWNKNDVLVDYGGGNTAVYPLWLGDLRLSTNESSIFGAYEVRCSIMDSVLSTNRVPLAILAAGNHRDPVLQPPFQPIPHLVLKSQLPAGIIGAETNGIYVLLTNTTHYTNGGTNGYDTLSSFANSKNALLVGSSSKNPERDTNWVHASDFSAYGPTDDGRIKPDIAAPGESLTSAFSTSDGAFGTLYGTSMSAPVVSGGLALVEEFAKRLHGTNLLWNGATYKALAIGSADEMGDAPGPDYKSGHGLFNAQSALNYVY